MPHRHGLLLRVRLEDRSLRILLRGDTQTKGARSTLVLAFVLVVPVLVGVAMVVCVSTGACLCECDAVVLWFWSG